MRPPLPLDRWRTTCVASTIRAGAAWDWICGTNCGPDTGAGGALGAGAGGALGCGTEYPDAEGCDGNDGGGAGIGSGVFDGNPYGVFDAMRWGGFDGGGGGGPGRSEVDPGARDGGGSGAAMPIIVALSGAFDGGGGGRGVGGATPIAGTDCFDAAAISLTMSLS
ncbi:MAG: hypothetical protein NVS3B10_17250 [Polyangiales bacterium]